jgi:beta-glucosidase
VQISSFANTFAQLLVPDFLRKLCYHSEILPHPTTIEFIIHSNLGATALLKKSACSLSLLLILCPFTWSQSKTATVRTAPDPLSDPVVQKKVDALLRQMTLEEKVGQLVQYTAGKPTGPGTGRSDYKDMLAKGEVGALFNVTNAAAANGFQHVAVEKSRLHIPILFGDDVIHGFRTEFPVPLGLASTWNPDLVERAARVAAKEASAGGVRWAFSPMVDIARDARWGRMVEGSGEDTFLGSVMAGAYVRGYQGPKLDAPDSVASCAKHFVGYGAAEGGRDYNSTEISEHTLRQYYLPPFKAAIDAGTLSIMSAFNAVNGVPSSANPFTLRQILRSEWKFQGVVDSDYTAVSELINHGIANDGAGAARRAILGGVDMDMESSLYHDHLAELVRSGKVPQSDVDQAVRRVLAMKFVMGLFDHPYTDEGRESQAMLQPESVALAEKAAEQSLVLLKNSSGQGGSPLLPLGQHVNSIALIGPLGDDAGNMLGSWVGAARAEDAVTLKSALEKRISADRLIYAKGAGISDGSDDDMAAAVSAATKADTVILALGEDAPGMTGEAASRAHLGLPGRQEELLEKIVATGKPVVLIVFSGRPLTLPWAFEHVPAVMAAWFPGIQAGPALVRTLFGEANPTGKLVVSWPRSVGQEPLYYNSLSTGRPAKQEDLPIPPKTSEEKYVSRYIDEQNTPQFPFGYGLSYTTFRYGSTQLHQQQLKASQLSAALGHDAKPVLTASAEVSNTGSRSGDEIVQLYVRLQGTSVAQPVRALKGFQRVSLAAGETKKVTFQLAADAFSLWNDQNQLAVEPSRATIWISPDSAHGAEARIEIVP